MTGYGLDGLGIKSWWEARFSAPVQTGPGAHPACCTMGTGSFSGVKSGQGLTLTPHPLLVPCSRKSRAIPLLPLWAVCPVQSLSACARLHFTFFMFFFLNTVLEAFSYNMIHFPKKIYICYESRKILCLYHRLCFFKYKGQIWALESPHQKQQVCAFQIYFFNSKT